MWSELAGGTLGLIASRAEEASHQTPNCGRPAQFAPHSTQIPAIEPGWREAKAGR